MFLASLPRVPRRAPMPGRKAITVPYIPPYSTTFAGTENPLVEDGGWRLGLREGASWQDARSSGGDAFGVAVSAGYDDCIACRTGFPTNHYAEGVCSLAGGYSPGVSHEVELLVGWTITNGVARGYEVTWGIGLDAQIVRWNGDLGNFTLAGGSDDNLATGKAWLNTPTGTGGTALADTTTARVEFQIVSGNPVITVYRAGVQIWQVTDSSANKITSGGPGMGFFARTGATMASYCWHSWNGGGL